ncbi:hypothetical protein BCAR13_700022 [Paraburkholderia caribensis]|nr:hypothetical protein BCAR13_700022 [Paraburkholderia caribensis]
MTWCTRSGNSTLSLVQDSSVRSSMRLNMRLAALPPTALVTLASAQRAPSLADEAAAARANAEQNQQLQQQRDAQQREQIVNAPAMRSTVPTAGVYPDLPHESTCFRIDTFALDVPATLPDVARKHGASNLPLDPFLVRARMARPLQGRVYRQGRTRHAHEGTATDDPVARLCDDARPATRAGYVNGHAESRARAGCGASSALCRS